jgi:hypothetical protein
MWLQCQEGDPKHVCKCAPIQVEKYMARIGGPLLDRIDLHIEVPPVPFEDLSKPVEGTGSISMREQVHRARGQGSPTGTFWPRGGKAQWPDELEADPHALQAG